MYKNLVAINKFSTLTRTVELYDSTFDVNKYTLSNALIKYCLKTPKVYLLSGDQLYLVGKIYEVYNNDATVDLLDNSYGSFVQRMLYHAVDYKLLARGLGQVSINHQDLLGFTINQLIITNYTKWF